jgi:hypothetical protein
LIAEKMHGSRRMEWPKGCGRGKRIEGEQSNGGVGGVETFSVLYLGPGVLRLTKCKDIVQLKVQGEMKNDGDDLGVDDLGSRFSLACQLQALEHRPP